jgi:hypothetical protein
MKFSKTITSIFCFVLISFWAERTYGQGLFGKKNVVNQYASVGFGGGTSHYFGELSPYSTFYYGLITNVRWNATINYTRYITPNFGLRFGFTWARISGDDFNYSKNDLAKFYNSYFRNLHFRNDIKEFTVQGIFNLIHQDGRGSKDRNNITPYLAVGVGFYGHNPQARAPASVDGATGAVTIGEWTSLKSYETAGQGLGNQYSAPYSLVQIVAPIGLGARFRINDKFDFTAEIGYRITPFDYLDDVGNDKYADPNDLLTDESRGFADRSREDIAARTGESRVSNYQWIYENVLGAASASGLKPSTNNPDTGFTKGDTRGSKRWDSYLLTQFSLHYIISNEIKCPVMR